MNKRNIALTAETKMRDSRPPGRSRGIRLSVMLIALSPGCGLLRAPQQLVTGADRSKQPDPVDLQIQVQRFADEYVTRSAEAIDEYGRHVGTVPARLDALRWKLTAGSSTFAIASGPNPKANMLDLVAVASLTRMTIEDYWSKTPDGPAFRLWLEASRSLETNAWNLAASVLKPAQLDELRNAIAQWHARNPEARSNLFARPQEFAVMVKTEGANGADINSVFGLVGLDPTSGLDPAVREVTRTRLFAERAMYTFQRMPFLLRWQVEFLADQLASKQDVQLALTNVSRLTESADRVSRATESVSQTAAQLPDRIAAERQAILAALEAQEGRLRDVTAEVRQLLAAGDTMSTSLNTTLLTFDALMKRFGVGEPKTVAAPDTPAPPFNILDYAHTAEQLALTSKELDILIKDVGATLDSPALGRRLQDLSTVSDRAKADAKSLLDHAFLLGVGLILFTFACAWAYRRLASRAAAR